MRFERPAHEYVDRATDRVVTERLFGDWFVKLLYGPGREHAPTLFRALTSRRASALLARANFDLPFAPHLTGHRRFFAARGIDLAEALDPPERLDTPRKLFERRIRYWECRPLPQDEALVVSPADARVVVGNLRSGLPLYLKGKFFEHEELLGRDKWRWIEAFTGGDAAIFRLTPEQYHYSHAPVSGTVADIYTLDGHFHACNPGAVVELVTPYSKNRRVVTIIDTDVPGGSRLGLVAMIEVVALMIGEVVQCYSAVRYDDPVAAVRGLFVRRGAPKSLYRPGSSTDVLIFQPGRIAFADDLVRNLRRAGAQSRFSLGFGLPLVETEVRVRSPIATRVVRKGGHACGT